MAIDRFVVVRNAEEQYSVWFADRELPEGWERVGFEGSRADCLARVQTMWKELLPLGLRRELGRA